MRRVFFHISYIFLALGIAAVAYAAMTWIPLWSLFLTIFAINQGDVLGLLFSSLFDFPVWDSAYVVILSALIGTNTAMLVFYFRLNRALPSARGTAAGIAGTIAGFLGFGCAACGSLFATTLIASITGAGFASGLPLDGFVFQITGMGLLVFSIYQLARAINKPLVCPI